MHFIGYYSEEIYSVITLFFLTLSAIFVTPAHLAQQLALAYALAFLLHEWEENVYPGGFVDMMVGEVIHADVAVTTEGKKTSRIYVDFLILVYVLVPYFFPGHLWLILPALYLGFLEGIVHTASIRIFKLHRRYTPGMLTAMLMFALSAFALALVVQSGAVEGWQYAVGALLLIATFIPIQRQVVRTNGMKYRDLPKMIRANLRRVHGMR
ncbi:HXXEE domain-containing protein [Adlercreutzia sp. ZJ473]|uniref:HXXEE domain-containing protein n=1 Tax=Adlercreutzia sp. ZJ473 TaxID=2722822 RepID=UPI001557BAA0|nr:HXXEE domain-containing protein [Adlercreutzia sp. ZJ473]